MKAFHASREKFDNFVAGDYDDLIFFSEDALFCFGWLLGVEKGEASIDFNDEGSLIASDESGEYDVTELESTLKDGCNYLDDFGFYIYKVDLAINKMFKEFENDEYQEYVDYLISAGFDEDDAESEANDIEDGGFEAREKKHFIDWLKSNGYDAVRIAESDSDPANIAVWDSSKIKF